MDPLEELYADVQRDEARKTAKLKKASDVSDDEWEWADDVVESIPQNNLLGQELKEKEEQLRHVMLDLADHDIRIQINKNLESISFDSFIHYYASNPDLAEYTMKRELDRMEYTAIYCGIETKDRSALSNIFEKTALHDFWGMANQSIYADVLCELYNAYVPSDLPIAVQSSSSRFILDFDKNIMNAAGLFSFSVPRDLNGSKTVIATLSVNVTVDLLSRTLLYFVDSPSLKVIFDPDIRSAKTSLLLFVILFVLCKIYR
jgi:hypothetical protein